MLQLLLRVVLLILTVHRIYTRTEFVALIPTNNMGPVSASTVIQWINVTYPENVSSATDVTFSVLSNKDDQLGEWYDLDPKGAQLTAKIFENKMYVLQNDGNAPSQAGCCANTLAAYDKSDVSKSSIISLTGLIQTALNVSDAYASHTFDVSEVNGKPVAFFQVRYSETSLNSYGDAIVAVDLETETIVPTKDGASSFQIYRDAGTEELENSVFKIQFYKSSDSVEKEQWHGNGVLRFRTKDDVTLLAFTHRFMSEAVIFKDPWSYDSSSGGGNILQRFGTPQKWDTDDHDSATYRYFGLSTSESVFVSGVHNVFYTSSSETTSMKGKETISLFVNSQDGKSATFEFELKLVMNEGVDVKDDVFQTEYVSASCSFKAPAQGGARAIGNGVFLVMSGADHTGLEVVDVNGNSHSQAYTLGGNVNLYDPFVRVVVS